MKCYCGNHGYRGGYFDVKIHAKSRDKASELWKRITGEHLGAYHISQYFYTNPSDEKEPKIMVKPYGNSARILFPPTTEWIPIDEAMRVIDASCE